MHIFKMVAVSNFRSLIFRLGVNFIRYKMFVSFKGKKKPFLIFVFFMPKDNQVKKKK